MKAPLGLGRERGNWSKTPRKAHSLSTYPMTLKSQINVALLWVSGFLPFALLLGIVFLSVAALSSDVAPPGHVDEICSTTKGAR